MNELFDLLTAKEMTFEEAVAYFGNKLPLTANEFYQLADQ